MTQGLKNEFTKKSFSSSSPRSSTVVRKPRVVSASGAHRSSARFGASAPTGNINHNTSKTRFGSAAQRLVDMASPGDIYYFENIKARCPGDPAARKINSLVFKIN